MVKYILTNHPDAFHYNVDRNNLQMDNIKCVLILSTGMVHFVDWRGIVYPTGLSLKHYSKL